MGRLLWVVGIATSVACGHSGGRASVDAAQTDASSDKDLTSFSFEASANPGIRTSALGTITNSDVAIVTHWATDITGLAASFTTTGADVDVGMVAQTSGMTRNDFTNPVTYTVVAANGSTRDYSVKLAVETLAAHADLTAGNTPIAIAAGDLNADGKPDLAVANLRDATVGVYLDQTATDATTPSFSAGAFATGSGPTSVAIADLNGDGKPDLAVANNAANTVSVLLNTTPSGAMLPTFAGKVDFATGSIPQSLAVADLDGDGAPDVAVAVSGGVSVLLNGTTTGSSTPSFAAHVDFATGQGANGVAIGDIDGDGKPDLAVADGLFTDTVSVLINTSTAGNASFANHVDFASGTTNGSAPYAVTLADLNADSRLDLAVANYNNGNVSVLVNTTSTSGTPSFASHVEFTTGSGAPTSVAARDLDGDGRLDLVVANYLGTGVAVLLNTTPASASIPTFTARFDFSTGSTSPWPFSVVADDFNGDGKLDVAAANYMADTVAIMLAR